MADETIEGIIEVLTSETNSYDKTGITVKLSGGRNPSTKSSGTLVEVRGELVRDDRAEFDEELPEFMERLMTEYERQASFMEKFTDTEA